jgi:DNA polymerase III sliding clamp (beta) subunit (PCNA family)
MLTDISNLINTSLADAENNTNANANANVENDAITNNENDTDIENDAITNNENNNDDDNDIILVSQDLSTFVILFEVLNNFTDILTLEFKEKGVKILFVDTHQMALIFVKLNSDSFTKYRTIQNNAKITFSLQDLCSFIKLAKKEKYINVKTNVLSIRVKKSKIYFDFTDENTSETVTYSQTCLDDEIKIINLPQSTSFEKVITMENSKFFEICKMTKKYSDYIQILCDDKKIIFGCNDISKTFINNNSVKITLLKNDIENKLIFGLKDLIKLEKLSLLSHDIQLYLKSDYPLFLNVHMGTLGKFIIGMSPVE